MEPLQISTELRLVGILIVFLFVMTLYLVVVALWIRSANARKKRLIARLEEQLYPRLFDYLDERISADEMLPVPDSKHATTTLSVLEGILFDYVKHLQGDEYERIQKLLSHSRFMDHHRKQLQSQSDRTQLKACLYFGHLENLPTEIAPKIEQLLQSNNRLLAHAATSAMMSSRNLDARFRALSVAVFRKAISEMALLELVYGFHRTELDQSAQEAELIMRLVRNELVPAENVALLIRALADLNLVYVADQLLVLLQKPNRYDVDGKITESLIRAMTEFFMQEALPYIRPHIYHQNPSVRKMCARAFGAMGIDEDLKALHNLLYDEDYTVRFEAVKALSEFGEEGHKVIELFMNHRKGDIRRIAKQVLQELSNSKRPKLSLGVN
jgi:hypothetical protein